MVHCPTELELERFLDGRGSDEERGRIEAHRSSCDTCRAWLHEASADEEVVSELRRVHAEADASELALDVDGPDDRPALSRYRVLRRLGAGGMGVVYEAEQHNPRRHVALKVLRPGISERALKRFEHEAQVLARLEHPGIARILEAGTFESHGEPQPFFAMELVEGSSLTRWADERELSPTERMTLFVKVCEAVQHAHQKGVVHRDLKPANILVTADGEPKVLDFGVARTFDVDVQVTSIRSVAGEIVGTLPYMSPEQLAGDPLEIDTRTDVYALGVLLYELLAGHLPYRTTGRSVPEAIKLIETTEPEPLGASKRELAGDLETIARKALEKDKELRYSSAEALAEDVRHFLRHEPIDARPPSAIYHLRKFARRNRAVVTALALTIAALVFGIAATSWQAMRARQAEAATRDEAAAVEEVNDFLNTLIGFDQDDPLGVVWDWDTTLREVVEDAERRLTEEPLNDKRSESRIRVAIGNFWRRLEDLDRAGRNLERALQLRREIYPPGHLAIAEALNTVGVLRHDKDDMEGAEAAWREALEIYDELGDAENAAKIASTTVNLSACALRRGDLDEAERLLIRGRAMHTAADGPNTLHVASCIQQLGAVKLREGDTEAGIALFQEAIEVARLAGKADHPYNLGALLTLGAVLHDHGRPEEAGEMLRDAAERMARVLGEDHPDTARSKLNLALTYQGTDRSGECETLAREATAVYRRHPDSLDLARALVVTGRALNKRGAYGESLPILREAEGLYGRLGAGPLRIAEARGEIGTALLRLERFEEAESYLRRAVEVFRRNPGQLVTQAMVAHFDLGWTLYSRGDLLAAEESLRTGLKLAVTLDDWVKPRVQPLRLSRHADLAKVVADQGRAAEAERIVRAALNDAVETLGPRHTSTCTLTRVLALFLRDRGDGEVAVSLLRELVADDVADGERSAVAIQRALVRIELGTLLAHGGQTDEALALVDEALAISTDEALRRDERARLLASGARVLLHAGRPDRAEAVARTAIEAYGHELPRLKRAAQAFLVHAQALIALERFDEAEDVLYRCLDGVDQLSGDRSELRRQVVDELVAFYESQGRDEEAADLREGG